MEQYFFIALGTCGMILQVVVIYAIVRSSLRRFGGLFFYLIILFLTSVADMAAFFGLKGWPGWYETYYYINNTLRHFAGFGAIISLIYVATAEQPRRHVLGMKLLAGTVITIAVSFLLALGTSAPFPPYMVRVGRNLSFATLVLNLVLWFSLIKTRVQDRRLLLASGGFGVNMAGEAIANSLPELSQRLMTYAGLIGVVSHLLCLFIWWRTFQQVERSAPVADTVG
jgi:hypothetical protein